MFKRYFAVLASLVLVMGCNGNNDNGDTDTVHTGVNDPLTPNDPFEGEILITISFAPVFNDVSEECMIALTCTSTGDGSVTKTTTQRSDKTFTVDADASCAYVLGDTSICTTHDGRPCHKDATGVQWTKKANIPILTDGAVIETEGDFYFGTAELRCVASRSTWSDEYVTHDLYVDENNEFEINGMIDGESWLKVTGAWLNLGGGLADAGYHTENVELAFNSLTFDYTGLAPTHVECNW